MALNLEILRPGRLDLGRSAPPGNTVALSGALALRGRLALRTGYSRQRHAGIALAAARMMRATPASPLHDATRVEQRTASRTQAAQGVACDIGTAVTAGAIQAVRMALPLAAAVDVQRAAALRADAGEAVGHSASSAAHAAEQCSTAPTMPQKQAYGWQVQQSVPAMQGRPEWLLDGLPMASAELLRRAPAVRAEQAQPPPGGWRIEPYVPPPPSHARGRLALLCPHPGRLALGNRCWGSAALRVAIRRSYRIINTASLVRDSDDADIACSSITLALDREAWSWSLSASLLGADALENVPAPPAAVRVTVNGYAWRFLIDDVSTDRSFGQRGISISGRSLAARMADPYARTREYTETQMRTAQQLALQELPAGWQLDWQLPDWTVPARTYSYTGLTPLESVKRIVKAAGGWLYADRNDLVIHAVPKWPQKPWAWDFAADMSLPSSYVLSESRQTQLGAAYDAILVCGGVNHGVAVLVTRAGQPGTDAAPSVTDSLITDIEPAKARAIQELADGWPLRSYGLSLPLQPQPDGAGLITPGQTLDFVDGADGWRGLVTGTRISVSATKITQSLEIISP